MLNRMQSFFEQEFQLKPDQPLLVAVSGGADSLCLLDSLVRLDYPVVVAHFNHLLRPEAGQDARTVEEVAIKMEVPFVLGKGSTADFARENNLSVEQAARELRYRFLFEQAEKYSAQAVAVGHHADDQVETVLMHLLRGAGLDGLTGMPYHSLPNPWSKTIPLIRPLLNTWRAEIETYCTARGLTPLIDQTNIDTTYFRNRLRHELVPKLETYVPGFRARLWQTSDLLAADRAVLNEYAEKAWQEIEGQMGSSYIRFCLSAFILQPLALRRRLIRRAISNLRQGARDVDYEMVQRALEFAAQPASTGQADLGLGLRIALEGDCIIISDWQTELPAANYPQITQHYELPVPGELDIGNGWFLRAEIPTDLESAKREAQENQDPFQAWVDLDERQPLLSVRPRLPGERFQPLGMEGKSTKVSDFMINEKIPQRVRNSWPLVYAGDKVVWVPGFRLSHKFQLTPRTTQVVRLILSRI